MNPYSKKIHSFTSFFCTFTGIDNAVPVWGQILIKSLVYFFFANFVLMKPCVSLSASIFRLLLTLLLTLIKIFPFLFFSLSLQSWQHRMMVTHFCSSLGTKTNINRGWNVWRLPLNWKMNSVSAVNCLPLAKSLYLAIGRKFVLNTLS